LTLENIDISNKRRERLFFIIQMKFVP